MPGSFFDSNVLIYMASRELAKAKRAEALVAGGGTISVQVLNEVAHVLRRKARLDWTDLRVFLRSLRGLLRIVPLTVETHDAGLILAERYGLSTFDALIVAAASIDGCDTVWSEDMQHDLLIDRRLRIANPFQT